MEVPFASPPLTSEVVLDEGAISSVVIVVDEGAPIIPNPGSLFDLPRLDESAGETG